MTEDVFASDHNSEAPPAVNPVEALVGDGKKFKTVEDLARGKLESDAFIKRLTDEAAELRAELAKKNDADAQLAALREEMQTLRTANPQPSRENTNPALTIDSVKALVNESITQAERNRTVHQNVTTANDAMVKHFGSLENAASAVKAKATEVGMTVEALRDIAARSPTAFTKIMGVEMQISSNEPLNPASATREVVNKPAGDPIKGTKPYYEKMRKETPNQYWSPAIQQEIFQATKAGTYQL